MENEIKADAMERAGELSDSQAMMGCTCGLPSTVGVMHRSDGPCYVIGGRASASATAVTPQSVSVPDGMALVPLALTQEMVDAWESAPTNVIPGMSDSEAQIACVTSAWDAMLTAAPAAPLPQPQADGDDRCEKCGLHCKPGACIYDDEPQGEGSIDSISDDLGFTEVLGEFMRYMADGQPFGSGSLPLTRYIDSWHSARLARTAAPSEYAWVVEWHLAGAPITYFAMGNVFPDFDFAIISKALRFARKEDADSAARWVARNDKRMRSLPRDIRVAEHQWPAVAAPAPSEPQAIPTDLSKRLRVKAHLPFGPEDFALLTQAADEIDRYYGSMLAWKKTAEAKDAASTWVDEITFSDFIDYGTRNGANIVGGMPWSFQYKGHAVSHENDYRYLINVPGPIHTLNFTPGDLLVTHADGTLGVIKDSDRAMLIHCMRCMQSSMERTAPGSTNWDAMIEVIKQHIATKGGAA